MIRSARLWKGAGPMTLGGLLLISAAAMAADPPALSDQLIGLAKQAKREGRRAEAARFYAEALKLAPNNLEAKRGFDELRTVRLTRQDEKKAGDNQAVEKKADTPAPPAAEVPKVEDSDQKPNATIDRSEQIERVLVQQLTAAANERLAQARDELNKGNPEGALNILRLGLTAIQGQEDLPVKERDALAARLQSAIRETDYKAEQLDLARAEGLRKQQSAQQRVRVLEDRENDQLTTSALHDALRHADGPGVLQRPVQRRHWRHRQGDRSLR